MEGLEVQREIGRDARGVRKGGGAVSGAVLGPEGFRQPGKAGGGAVGLADAFREACYGVFVA